MKKTLNFSARSGERGLSQKQYAVLILGVYFGIVGVAAMTGYWQNSISTHAYLALFRNLSGIGHGF